MSSSEKEALKGKLLDLWLEDLRADRRPRMAPEMEHLSNKELEEVMELARWHKAALAPTQLEQGALDGLASSILGKLSQQRSDERRAVEAATAGTANFSTTLQAVREQRHVSEQSLERALGITKGTVGLLESGELPPHRVAVERMVKLLQTLHLNSARIVELVREAGMAWARDKFGQPQMRLGRIDPSASEQERRELLEGAEDDGLNEEMERVEAYCRALAARLPSSATAGRAG